MQVEAFLLDPFSSLLESKFLRSVTPALHMDSPVVSNCCKGNTVLNLNVEYERGCLSEHQTIVTLWTFEMVYCTRAFKGNDEICGLQTRCISAEVDVATH